MGWRAGRRGWAPAAASGGTAAGGAGVTGGGPGPFSNLTRRGGEPGPGIGDRLLVRVRAEGASKVLAVLADVETEPVSYTHLRAPETVLELVCRLLLEKKKTTTRQIKKVLRNNFNV